MSTHQQSKLFLAKKSMAEESGRPGTCRSKVGCAAIEEPCTNRMVPAVAFGSAAYFSNRNSFTPPGFSVQCSSLLIAAAFCAATSFMTHPLLFPGPSAARSGALQTRDRHNTQFEKVPEQRCIVSPAPHPGNKCGLLNQRDVIGLDYLGPFVDLSLHESGKLGLRHHHGRGALRFP